MAERDCDGFPVGHDVIPRVTEEEYRCRDKPYDWFVFIAVLIKADNVSCL